MISFGIAIHKWGGSFANLYNRLNGRPHIDFVWVYYMETCSFPLYPLWWSLVGRRACWTVFIHVLNLSKKFCWSKKKFCWSIKLYFKFYRLANSKREVGEPRDATCWIFPCVVRKQYINLWSWISSGHEFWDVQTPSSVSLAPLTRLACSWALEGL